MVFDIFKNLELKKEFWDWYCSLEILERYAQHCRLDLWENYKEKKGFKGSSYKLQFLSKSSLEQALIMVDFLEYNYDISITYGLIYENGLKHYYSIIDGKNQSLYLSLENFPDKVDAYIDGLNYILDKLKK